jgi:hypothetical protein
MYKTPRNMPDPPFLHIIATAIVVFVLTLHYLFLSSREVLCTHCAPLSGRSGLKDGRKVTGIPVTDC